MLSFLPPAMMLGQGNIFRSMCQEFCPSGVWADTPWSRHPPRQTPHWADTSGQRPQGADHHPGQTPPWADTPWEQTPIPRADTPPWSRHPQSRQPPTSNACWEIRTTSGWYTSYWNAYLLLATMKLWPR